MAQISEAELERRRKLLEENTIIAGPDHPIYQGGLRITSVPSLQPSASKKRPPGGMVTYPDDF